MKMLARIVERLSWLIILVGGLGLLIAMALGVADVIGSYFGRPVPGAYEFTESAMVLVVFGGLTYAQIRGKHIRVELLYMHMSPRVQSAMDLVAGVASMAFITLLLWQALGETQYSWEIGEATSGLVRFPLFPARLVLLLGVSLFLVQLILQFIEDIQRLAEGRGGRVDELDLAEIDAISGGDTRA